MLQILQTDSLVKNDRLQFADILHPSVWAGWMSHDFLLLEFQHMCVIQNANSPLDCELCGGFLRTGTIFIHLWLFCQYSTQLLSDYNVAGSLVGTKKTENNLRFITPLLWPMTFVTYNWTIATEVLGNYFHCLMNTRLRMKCIL